MLTVVALTMLTSASSGQTQAEANVIDRVPDYVAPRGSGGGDEPQSTVRHHDGWLRIDGSGGQDGYFERPGLHMSFKRAPDGGRYDSLMINQGSGVDLWQPERKKTEKRVTYLAETCAIWDLVSSPRVTGSKHVFDRDCVTSDGIIVAHGRAAEDGGILEPPEWRLTSLTRTAVAEKDVSPPADLFDWRNYAGFAAPMSAPGTGFEVDFVTKMEGGIAPAGDGVRYTKRHFPWVRTDTRFKNGDWTVKIENLQNHAQLWFYTEKNGSYAHLSISEPRTWMRDRGSDAGQERLIVKSGTLLGEACKITSDLSGERQWTEWRTADGIELKYEAEGGRWANPEEWTAVDLQRRPVDLSEVMPPEEIFDRARWGLSRQEPAAFNPLTPYARGWCAEDVAKRMFGASAGRGQYDRRRSRLRGDERI